MRWLRRLLFYHIILISVGAVANESTFDAQFRELETGSDEFGSYSLGHNLSTNARTLKKGQTSAGTMYAAHGLTDELTIGVSPFVLQTFEMFNLMVRQGFQLAPDQRLSLDLAYFKTFGGKEQILPADYCLLIEETGEVFCPQRTRYTGFVMEAANAKLTLSQQISKFYRFNTTASFFYFWDDRNPFSFRMDPANSDDYALNLTTLHEFKLSESLFINYELGMWGMNYTYPYAHTGLTVGLQTFSLLISFGMSTTYSFSFPENQERRFWAGYTSRASFHPEFEIQYFF